MTVARSQIVDETVTCWYHCTSRCVRRAFLCGEGCEHRKQWLEDRLEELSSIFCIDVGGFALLDNHLHVLVRLAPERRDVLTDEEIVDRWTRLFPKRDKHGNPLPVNETWKKEKLADGEWLSMTRSRLGDLGWFMKCLKEPLARMANREDGCRGSAFWEARYRSVAILDEESLLAASVYVDLNPFAANLVDLPEESPHTSIRCRVESCRESGTLDEVTGLAPGAVPDEPLEDETHWLCPIQDRRERGSSRVGLLADFTLTAYLRLVDSTSRLFREGKATLDRNVAGILERLGIAADRFQAQVCGLLDRAKPIGHVFGNAASLEDCKAKRGVRYVKNLAGRPA